MSGKLVVLPLNIKFLIPACGGVCIHSQNTCHPVTHFGFVAWFAKNHVVLETNEEPKIVAFLEGFCSWPSARKNLMIDNIIVCFHSIGIYLLLT